MSRSVSAPSSVTKTSPCWNGLIVPGSTLRYGSNFCSWTRRPRALSRRPSEAATIPFPRAETTPPVTKTYFGARALTGFQGSTPYGRTSAASPASACEGTLRPMPPKRGAWTASVRLASYRGKELLSAEHPLELGFPGVVAELLDSRVRRVARRLLHPKVAIRERGDLRKVRDGHDLSVLRESPEQRADGVCRLAADPRVDLVEHERVAAGHDRDGQRDPRQLPARGRLRDLGERQPRIRADEEHGLIGSGRARLVPLPQLADELALAHADPAQLGGDRVGERRPGRVPLGPELEGEPVDTFLGRRE